MGARGRQCIEAARRLVGARAEALPSEQRNLLAACFDAVGSDPLLLEPLWEPPGGAVDEAVAALAGLLSARLRLMHAHLDPLDVGEAEAAAAGALLGPLLDWEGEARRRAESAIPDHEARELALLAHDTSLVLSPPPPSLLSGRASISIAPPALRALVDRWERRRAARPLGPRLRDAWAQNRGFFRWGFAMPAYALRVRRIRRSLPEAVAGHSTMRETFAAIEQVGPVVDNFVFLGEGRVFGEPHVAVADLAFLYMQIADEMVDNVLKRVGAQRTLALVEAVYPRGGRDTILVPLESLDEGTLRAHGVDPAAPLEKYGFSLAESLEVLRSLRAALLGRLDVLPEARREPTLAELQGFFHHCFATFLDELHLPRVGTAVSMDQLDLRDVAWHFFRKNNAVMMRWLVLRARAQGLAPERYADAIREWGAVLANFQIFDDLKDVFLDHGVQPNYALHLAATSFPDEYRWIGENVGRLGPSISVGGVRAMGRAAAQTVLQCLRLSRLMALARFGWLTVYVWDQRWQKSWTSAEGSFNRPDPGGEAPPRDGSFASGHRVVDALFDLFERTAALAARMEADEEYLAYVFDLFAYDHPHAVRVALFPRLRALYRFGFLRMLMSHAEKTGHLQRVLTRHREAARRALSEYLERGEREGFRVEPLELRLRGWLGAPATSLRLPARVSAPPRPEQVP